MSIENKQKIIGFEVKCITNEVVREHSLGEFMEFSQRLDNKIDGVIVWKEHGKIVDIIYVKCKGGDSYFPKDITSKFRVQNIKKENMKMYKSVWNSVSGQAIMVITNSKKKLGG